MASCPACGELTDIERHAIDEFKDVKQKVESLLDQFKFREAQFEAMNLAHRQSLHHRMRAVEGVEDRPEAL